MRAKEQKGADLFNWSVGLMEPFYKHSVDRKWGISLIQGYFGMVDMFFQNQKLFYALISRRCRYMAGTRFNSRGTQWRCPSNFGE
jgi:hypothetical protein